MEKEKMLDTPLGELLPNAPYLNLFFRSVGISHFQREQTAAELFAVQNELELESYGVRKKELSERFLSFAEEKTETRAEAPLTLSSLTIEGGKGKDGLPEKATVTLCPGDVVSIVGATGSGKSRLLADIECLAQGDTPTGRKILVNGRSPDRKSRRSLCRRLVAQLSQNMNFVMDLSVQAFEHIHADVRMPNRPDEANRAVAAVLEKANQLAGESFSPETSLTQLSGGQSRALMIADAALLSESPIVLIDEIENAGIDRRKALSLLAGQDKIVLMATHDPILALLGRRRVIIRHGKIAKFLDTSPNERKNLEALQTVDERLMQVREMLRGGDALEFDMKSFLFNGQKNS